MKIYKVLILIIILLPTLLLAYFVIRPYKIHGNCMEPAVNDGKYYYSNQISPYLRNYVIGDIVFFNHEGKLWFSRIVALGGDTIHIKNENIIRNGNELHDDVDRTWDGWNYGTHAINKTLKVPKGYVYVLSDNLSAKHDDSRVFGPIKKSEITGVMW